MTRLFQLYVAKYLEMPSIKVWRFGNPLVFQARLISSISCLTSISFVSMVLYSFGPASNDYELMTFATKVHIVILWVKFAALSGYFDELWDSDNR